MQLIRSLLLNFHLNMFRASSYPSSGEQDRVLLHMVFCIGCVGCGCVELGRKLSQHNQCRTPYAVIHGLVLLMMGIMMPETCWDRSSIINIGLVASCWFISLHHNVNFLAWQIKVSKHYKVILCLTIYFCSWIDLLCKFIRLKNEILQLYRHF